MAGYFGLLIILNMYAGQTDVGPTTDGEIPFLKYVFNLYSDNGTRQTRTRRVRTSANSEIFNTSQ